jgi:[ribosomal protein S18]-alanine N-acetyltransferase
MSVTHIRWMIRVDMPAVLGIERESFPHNWDEDQFIAVLRQRNAIGLIAEVEDETAGYVIYELHGNRLHIMKLGVAKQYRHIGVGRAMVERLIGKLSSEKRNRIMLEVRESNLDAQLFFKRLGFRAVSILKDFYSDTDEDAYLMQYRVNQSAAVY